MQACMELPRIKGKLMRIFAYKQRTKALVFAHNSDYRAF
jgi:hypothetical protein